MYFSKPIYAYVLQVIIVANHMNGKDTHVRGLRVLGPLECALLAFDSDPSTYLRIGKHDPTTMMILSRSFHRSSRCTSAYDEVTMAREPYVILQCTIPSIRRRISNSSAWYVKGDQTRKEPDSSRINNRNSNVISNMISP